MQNLLGFQYEDLQNWLSEHSQPSYRADQILQWIYRKGVAEFSEMTNLSGELRELLSRHFSLRSSVIEKTSQSQDDVAKLLLRQSDGALTETVLISSAKRRTVCVSSQIGCPVRCAFCASGIDGLERSLDAAEIVEQVIRASELLPEQERVSNVVIMGMGEPLANYDETLKAVRIMNARWGLDIGARHITISTIGMPKRIRKLAHEPVQITLAVSLHAGDDELRCRLIPWAKNIKLEEIFSAIDYYYEQTHREVTLEYVLLDGVNSLPRHADQLAGWAMRSRCNVNLINYNTVTETGFRPVEARTVDAFMARLKGSGVNVHMRQSRGERINAACGQLRQRKIESQTIDKESEKL